MPCYRERVLEAAKNVVCCLNIFVDVYVALVNASQLVGEGVSSLIPHTCGYQTLQDKIAWLFETFGSKETKMIFKPVKLELVRESKAYFRSLIIFLLHCSVSNEQE